jgi:hypothetical protein
MRRLVTADAPTEAERPSLIVNVLVAVAAGLFLGVLIAIARDSRHQTGGNLATEPQRGADPLHSPDDEHAAPARVR